MATAKADRIAVTVRLALADRAMFDTAVRSLQAAGLDAIEAHRRFGIVNGVVAADKLDALGAIEGVASVRADKTYRALK